MAEEKNAWNPLFFVAQSEKPATIHNVKRESGGESDPYEGRPIQKREARNTTAPGGNQTGEHKSMNSKDSALYAHVYAETGDWENATPVWVLDIGRDVIGNQSHGVAQRVGVFSTPAAAVLAATERGVEISRVEVGE